MDQEENPFQGIRLGSCHMDEKTFINTFAVDPNKCSKLCEVTDDCEFWKARWDGSLCYLLTRDYRQVSTSSISSQLICFICIFIPIRHFTRTVDHLPEPSPGQIPMEVQTLAMPMLRMIVSTQERGSVSRGSVLGLVLGLDCSLLELPQLTVKTI